MTYHQIIQLKNGASCCLRSGTAADGQAALDNFILTHAETDNLLTYPEENTLTATQEGEYLQAKTESPNEVEILAIVAAISCSTAPSSASASLRNSGALALARHSPPPASTAPARLATPSWSWMWWPITPAPLPCTKSSALWNTAATPRASAPATPATKSWS